jgi:diguanylate cyclase (GGDEF)-like protein
MPQDAVIPVSRLHPGRSSLTKIQGHICPDDHLPADNGNALMLTFARILIWPAGVLFAILVTLVCNIHLDSQYLPTVLTVYPLIIFVPGLCLGMIFQRHRHVMMVLILAFADRLWMMALPLSAQPDPSTVSILDIIAFLLPIHLAAVVWMKEQRLLSVRGIIRIFFLLVEISGVIYAVNYHSEMIHRFVQYRFSEMIPMQLGNQLVLFSILFSVSVFLIRCIRIPTTENSIFLWVSTTPILAYYSVYTTPSPGLFFGIAGSMLLVSILESAYRMAYRDDLTRLPGRRALNQLLSQIGSHYAIAMIDIDHFKKINDRHGHDIGDQVLRMIATKILSVGGGGRAFRYGGEEFTVVFPGKTGKDARSHLEDLRESIASDPFYIRAWRRPRNKPASSGSRRRRGKKVSVTVSIGFSEPTARETSPEQVIKAADKALYRAKKSGRNRVTGRSKRR